MAFEFDSERQETGFPPTREAGLARLEAFAPRAGRAYAETRNYDHGPEARENVSLLSPWLRHRLILEEEVLDAVRARHSFSAAEKFIQEVYWRAYFKGWLEQRPQVWARYKACVGAQLKSLEKDGALRGRYDAATQGATGLDYFDAWARELVETGYLHNHTRMWFASIWIFTLNLPWALGADFFYRHLVDGDPASNTLSWRWVAGLHTKGKTYLARADNIAKYTDGRFQPGDELAGDALAIVEPDAGPAVSLPPADEAPGADDPYALLITEEDCAPQSLGLKGAPAGVMGLNASDGRSPLDVGDKAMTFTRGAVENALAHVAEAHDVTAHASKAEDWGAALVDLAKAAGVKNIVTAYAPVGPVADHLKAAKPALDEAGLRLLQVRRAYDAKAWPHATKGFFALKKKIPVLLGD